MSGKTATERLREMLDERGVPYETNDVMGASETRWNGFTAYQLTPNAKLVMHPTPEQAIAATLGSELNPDGLPVGLTVSEDGELLNWRGENYVKQSTLGSGALTADDVLNAVYKHGARWQAIADELNSRAERTCEWELEHSGTLYDKWRCSKCGYLFVESRCDQGYTDLEPNYCPNCGCKVMS